MVETQGIQVMHDQGTRACKATRLHMQSACHPVLHMTSENSKSTQNPTIGSQLINDTTMQILSHGRNQQKIFPCILCRHIHAGLLACETRTWRMTHKRSSTFTKRIDGCKLFNENAIAAPPQHAWRKRKSGVYRYGRDIVRFFSPQHLFVCMHSGVCEFAGFRFELNGEINCSNSVHRHVLFQPARSHNPYRRKIWNGCHGRS